MSQFILKDGQTGNTARINPAGRLRTLSVIRSHIGHESIDEEASYIFASGFITLTNTAGENAIFYMNNTDDTGRFFVIEHIRVCSDGAMGSMKIRYFYNPTGGTIISNAVDGVKTNLNIGSSNEPSMDVFTGGDNITATGGTVMTNYINHSPGHSVQDYQGALILQKNQSFAIFVQPSVSTDICVEVTGYFETLND